MNVLDLFHPVVREWFSRHFAAPTDAQLLGWPHIFADRDTLITAPTGSGKTLAAFLVSLDRLLRRSESTAGGLEDQIEVIYISPLKALSNDIKRNLEDPLAEIRDLALEMGYPDPGIRVALRTGDTTQYDRQQIVKRPPHILITTPESLYLMITAERSREVLRSVKIVIVDEIHALIRDKRGSHLALTLARLDHLCSAPLARKAGEGLGVRARPSRVGLSATVRPIEEAAQFLVGSDRTNRTGGPDCEIVDTGHQRDLELSIELPPTDLEAVASGEQWRDVYDRLAALIKQHRTTIIFVNARRMCEKVAYQLAERLGEEHIGSHHGSLSKEKRLTLERRLKAGEMKALVATASLELGIDIGTVDLVCQLQSPRSITTFLQRVGRSGHALGRTPKGALFPLTRDELVEGAALVRAVRSGRLDRVWPPVAPLDILAQQLVAETACEPWNEDDLYALVRRATPYSELSRADFDEIVELMSEGIAVGTGTVAAYLHRDRINGVVRGRRGARSVAIQCGGAIPEVADYRVLAEPDGTFVGTLDEDFSVESMAGDIILLGTTSWRIRRIEQGVVRVEDAHGAPPSIPFWLGEAPGRTLELSEEVSKLREEIAAGLPSGRSPLPPDIGAAHLDPAERPREDAARPEPAGRPREDAAHPEPVRRAAEARVEGPEALVGQAGQHPSDPPTALIASLAAECGLSPEAAEQLVRYIRAQKDGLGIVPTQRDIVFERFFDEAGGMQLVVHAPFGARINRAWGLALRKRFCVSFDFELQAAASDDAMLLSIGPQNSFPLDDMFALVKPQWAQESVEQSLLVANAPMWGARWRWNATRALAILRQRQGKKTPPPIQRMKADDLMAAVFPRLVACQENVTGAIELPDHPLIRQTMHDCLHEAMDLDGLIDVLNRIESGDIRLHSRDTTEPSVFAHEMLTSKPYTYLDDAPLEERRARAVTLRRTLPEHSRDLGVLDPEAIQRVVEEATPQPRDADELHDVLLSLIAVRPGDARGWEEWFDELVAAGRAALADTSDGPFWFAVEHLAAVWKLYPGADIRPELRLPPALATQDVDEDQARLTLLRGHVECLGPVTAVELARRTGVSSGTATSGLARLEGEGVVLRGRFRPGVDEEEFCDRRLLARIHRYTLDRLRREIEPVSAADLIRFLLRWQHIAPGTQLEGKRGLLEAVAQLQGFDVPALAWERHILPSRVASYRGSWLDELCLAGDVAWARLSVRSNGEPARLASTSSATPVSLTRRIDLPWLLGGIRNGAGSEPHDRGASRDILDLLASRGALFYDDIVAGSGRLATDVERGLWDLVARGLVTADGYQALRSLMAESRRRHFRRPQRARLFRTLAAGLPSGRWSLLPHAVALLVGAPLAAPSPAHDDLAEAWAEQLLFRYGVVFRDLLQRENIGIPWREILRVLRRMEAQGLVRGGRFVAGFYGEQYARPEAVESLRKVRRIEKRGELVRVSAVDPLNLVGILTPGPRTTAVHTKSVVYRDGVPLPSEEAAELLAPSRNLTVAKAG